MLKDGFDKKKALIEEQNNSKCHTVEVSIILACKSRTEQQTQGTIHPNSPTPPVTPPLSSDTKWCRSVTLVLRLEWSRQPSGAASHSHRVGRLPVTDVRRGSLLPSYCRVSGTRSLCSGDNLSDDALRDIRAPLRRETGVFTLWDLASARR